MGCRWRRFKRGCERGRGSEVWDEWAVIENIKGHENTAVLFIQIGLEGHMHYCKERKTKGN